MVLNHYIFAGVVATALGLWLLPFFLRRFHRGEDASDDRSGQSEPYGSLGWRGSVIGVGTAKRMVDEPFKAPDDY